MTISRSDFFVRAAFSCLILVATGCSLPESSSSSSSPNAASNGVIDRDLQGSHAFEPCTLSSDAQVAIYGKLAPASDRKLPGCGTSFETALLSSLKVRSSSSSDDLRIGSRCQVKLNGSVIADVTITDGEFKAAPEVQRELLRHALEAGKGKSGCSNIKLEFI